MRPRQRVLDSEKRLDLSGFTDALGLSVGSRVAVVPMGRGVYIAPIGSVGQRRKDGRPTTKELRDQAMRALAATPKTLPTSP